MRSKGYRPVVAGIASVPSRARSLKTALRSIWSQVDYVEVVLNGYDAVPPWLRGDRVCVARSQEIGDHADNAKFYGMQKYDDCIYFSIDDDIEYPSDYVARMLACMDRFGGQVAVGVHGAFVPAERVSFLHRQVFCFWDELKFDLPVSYVGTGTIAISRALMPTSPIQMFTETGMSDLFVASHLKEKGIPAICVRRPVSWLRKLSTRGLPSLWDRAQENPVRQNALLLRAAPWGATDLLDRCRAHALEVFAAEVRIALQVIEDLLNDRQISDDSLLRLRDRWSDIRHVVRSYAAPYADRLSNLGLP